MMGYINSFYDMFLLVSTLIILNQQKRHNCNHIVIKPAQLSLHSANVQ